MNSPSPSFTPTYLNPSALPPYSTAPETECATSPRRSNSLVPTPLPDSPLLRTSSDSELDLHHNVQRSQQQHCHQSQPSSESPALGRSLTNTRSEHLRPIQSPSSAAVQELLSLLGACRTGRLLSPDSTWKRVRIKPEEYAQFQYALAEDPDLESWVEDKARLDYNTATNEVVLRMRSAVHCKFIGLLALELYTQVKALRTDGEHTVENKARREHSPVSDAASRIGLGFTTDISFTTELKAIPDKKSPDQQFDFVGAKYPPVVLEIAYSQEAKSLPTLAEQYMESSDGAIKTVITIKVLYMSPAARRAKETKRTTFFTVYRYRELDDTEFDAFSSPKNQVFREADGSVPHGSLELRLSDFCPRTFELPNEDPVITIAHEDLAVMLEEAERREEASELDSAPESVYLTRRLRKRPRSEETETEPEEPSSQDQDRESDDTYNGPQMHIPRRVKTRHGTDPESDKVA